MKNNMLQLIRHSTTHPKFLQTNSTSHKWPFGAIAELADNALDAGSTRFHIDVELPSNEVKDIEQSPDSIILTDNGRGMDPKSMHKMLSFGHPNKINDGNSDHPLIGRYGNGFKSGSMRLGKDALVFSSNGKAKTIGFLSQTYLEAIKAVEVLVPIISYDISTNKPITNFYNLEESNVNSETHQENLKAILSYSCFKVEEELLAQFKFIEDTGTRIVITNLSKNNTNENEANETSQCEFSFSNPKDIRLGMDEEEEEKESERQESIAKYSLRYYLSILYFNPRMQIWLRGHKIRTKRIINEMWQPRKYGHCPKDDIPAYEVMLGFNKKDKYDFGALLYHNNRLIKFGLRVGFQLSPDSRGIGVLLVINVPPPLLQPTHNKQDFIDTRDYKSIVSVLADKLRIYWKETVGKGTLTHFWTELERASKRGPYWVQCTKCLKWRLTQEKKHPPDWECSMNIDSERASCDIDEDEFSWTKKPTKKKSLKKEDIPADLALPEADRIVILDGEAVQVKERPRRISRVPSRFEAISPSKRRREEYDSTNQNKKKQKNKSTKKTSCANCSSLQSQLQKIKEKYKACKEELLIEENKTHSMAEQLQRVRDQNHELKAKLRGNRDVLKKNKPIEDVETEDELEWV